MLKPIIFLLLVFTPSLMPHHALAQDVLFRSDQGKVHFTSDAPLELIKASSEALRGVIDPLQNTFAFTIETRTFEGFNSDLQKIHFNENYLESSKFPKATFAGKIIENIDWQSEGPYEIRAKGFLNIHGVKRERIILSEIEIFSDQVIIRSEFTVPLQEHEIDIPKIVAQKISEEIKVEIEITLVRQTSN